MRENGWAVHVAFLLAAAAAVSVDGAPRGETIVIGCLQRIDRDGYGLKDERSGITYLIDADGRTAELTLAWQVGHALEIHGEVTQTGTAARRLHALSVLEIATSCRPNPAQPQ